MIKLIVLSVSLALMFVCILSGATAVSSVAWYIFQGNTTLGLPWLEVPMFIVWFIGSVLATGETFCIAVHNYKVWRRQYYVKSN